MVSLVSSSASVMVIFDPLNAQCHPDSVLVYIQCRKKHQVEKHSRNCFIEHSHWLFSWSYIYIQSFKATYREFREHKALCQTGAIVQQVLIPSNLFPQMPDQNGLRECEIGFQFFNVVRNVVLSCEQCSTRKLLRRYVGKRFIALWRS